MAMATFFSLAAICLWCTSRACAANLKLSCGSEMVYCANDEVNYQCSIHVPGDYIMMWRVLNNSGSLIYQETFVTGDSAPGPANDKDDVDFKFILISNKNPLISNLSFTARTSINDYVVQCVEYRGPTETCTIYTAEGML